MRERTAVGDRRRTRQGPVCPAEGRLRARSLHACPDSCRWWCRPPSVQAICALSWNDPRLG
jgi:hypothetical protein